MCISCGVGMYSLLQGQGCTVCPANTFQPLLGAINASACVSCPVGKGSSNGAESCAVCSAGSVSKGTGLPCEPCPATSEPATNLASCLGCPEFTISRDGLKCRTCSNGTYCPPGATEELSCATIALGENPCLGYACREGYRGPQCFQCASPGYYRDTGDMKASVCKKCPNNFGAIILVVFAVCLFVAALCALPHFEKGGYLGGVDRERAEVLTVALQSLWARLNTFSNLSRIPYPAVLREAFRAVATLFASFLAAHAECTFTNFDFYARWCAAVGLFVGIFVLCFFIDVGRDDSSCLFLRMLPLGWMLPQLLQYSLDAVSCIGSASGQSVLFKEPSYLCPLDKDSPPGMKALGGFSVIFIIFAVGYKIGVSFTSTSTQVCIFFIIDTIRQLMTVVSVQSPSTAVALLFMFTIVQCIFAFAGESSLNKKPLAMGSVLLTSFITECVLIDVVRNDAPYSQATAMGVGGFLITLTLLSFIAILITLRD
jgi:hypothetical protein